MKGKLREGLPRIIQNLDELSRAHKEIDWRAIAVDLFEVGITCGASENALNMLSGGC